MLCSICREEILANTVNGYAGGNNPAPIYLEADERCCDYCDRNYVIPVRIADHLNVDTVEIIVAVREGRLHVALGLMREAGVPDYGRVIAVAESMSRDG